MRFDSLLFDIDGTLLLKGQPPDLPYGLIRYD